MVDLGLCLFNWCGYINNVFMINVFLEFKSNDLNITFRLKHSPSH